MRARIGRVGRVTFVFDGRTSITTNLAHAIRIIGVLYDLGFYLEELRARSGWVEFIYVKGL